MLLRWAWAFVSTSWNYVLPRHMSVVLQLQICHDCIKSCKCSTPNLHTDIMDIRGLDSNISLIIRGGIVMSIGDFPESLSQAILVGIMLVRRLAVTLISVPTCADPPSPHLLCLVLLL